MPGGEFRANLRLAFIGGVLRDEFVHELLNQQHRVQAYVGWSLRHSLGAPAEWDEEGGGGEEKE